MTPAAGSASAAPPGDLPFRSVAVVGLGLVGGSLARDLSALGIRVVGHDADPRTVEQAVEAGVVSAPVADGLEELGGADVVVLAVPVDGIRALLPRVAAAAGDAVLVTDVGSTKGSIVAAAEACGLGRRFVGAHPLAGDHRSGWPASRPGLFRGATTYLAPARPASPVALAAAQALWRAAGSRPIVMAADEHDGLMAWASHLPQAAATALAVTLAGGGHRRAALGRGGQDATRLAGSSPGMWVPLALDNAVPLAGAVAAMEQALAGLRHALVAQDRAAVERFFSQGKDWFDA